MVSSYVYDICKEYLDKFLFDFDKSQLSMSILSGNITLRDINLRPEEVNDFFKLNKLPITLKAGFASKLALTFSVISFHSQPIEIEFSDLSLVFGPSLHHMSNDISFIQREQTAASYRSDIDADQADSESSYDSMNAFNVHQHSLKNPAQKQRDGGINSNRQNFAAQPDGDPFSNIQQHKSWKEHQKFLQKLKLAKVLEQRTTGVNNQQSANAGGLENFDFQLDDMLNENVEDDSEQSLRSMLGQIQVKINGLHIRFEEDYFSGDKPYSMGLTADQFNLKSSPQGEEIWQFPDFLQSVFHTKPAESTTNGNSKGPKLGDLLFKDIVMQNMRMYVNTPSEIYIPTVLYEEYKHYPNQIFAKFSLSYLTQLMARRQGLNYINDPIDLIANFGDDRKEKAFLNVISGNLKLNISEPILTTLLTFKNYIEDIEIVQKLKQYRPQRKPITNSALEMKQYRGKDVQELPESVRRKRKLLVRDWFYYAVWYVRLRNVERKRPTAWDRLCKAQLAHDPDRYRVLIRAAGGGVKSMKEWLSKEEHIKKLEQKERNELTSDISIQTFDEVTLSLRLESLNIQLYEKALQVGIGLPLFDLSMNTLAYEKHLQRGHKKLGSRLAIGHLTLKQVHTMECELQSLAGPISSYRSSFHKQAQSNSVLSQILRNDRKMTNFNQRKELISASPKQRQSFGSQQSATQVTQPPETPGIQGYHRINQSQTQRMNQRNRQRMGGSTLTLANTMTQQSESKGPQQLLIGKRPPIASHHQGSNQNKLSSVLSAKYGTTSRKYNNHPPPISQSQTQIRHNSQQRNQQKIDQPQIMHQTQMPQSFVSNASSRSMATKAGPTSKGVYNTINPNSLMPCRRGSPVRPNLTEEGTLPRGTRFLTLLELGAPKHTPNDYRQNGGIPNCCLDFLYEVPRFSNALDQMAPLACLPTGLASLTRHIKIGELRALETHTDQLLEAVTKFYANYTWCIAQIHESQNNLLEPLFNISMSDWEDLFNKQMHIHVVERYLWSKRAEREAYVKKIKLNSCNNRQRERSATSNDSQVMDGVTTFGSTTNHILGNKIRKSSGINVPKMGRKANPLNEDREQYNNDNSTGEENLTDDAIKEIDYEFNRINSAQRNSPIAALNNGQSPSQLRSIQNQRERRDLVYDSPVLKAMFELIPRTPVDFRVIMSLHEAQIAVFSSHVPVMRINITAPTTITVTKESQMSSFQIGSLQSYFLSEPEMLFAFVKTLNAHLQGIFHTPLLRTEHSLQRLRSLIQDQLKVEQNMKKAATGTSYNMLFNNLADNDLLHDSQNASFHQQRMSVTSHRNMMQQQEESDKLPQVSGSNFMQHAATVSRQLTSSRMVPQTTVPDTATATMTASREHSPNQASISQHTQRMAALNNYIKKPSGKKQPVFNTNTGRVMITTTTGKPIGNTNQLPQGSISGSKSLQKILTYNEISGTAAKKSTLTRNPNTSSLGLNHQLRTSQTQREPLNNLAQNKRGLFQKQQPPYHNRPEPQQESLQEESKQIPSSVQQQLTVPYQMSAESLLFNNVDEDLDEKRIPSQLQQRLQQNQQRQQLGVNDTIQPPKVSSQFSMMSGKQASSSFLQQNLKSQQHISENSKGNHNDSSCIDYERYQNRPSAASSIGGSNIRGSITANRIGQTDSSSKFPPNSFN